MKSLNFKLRENWNPLFSILYFTSFTCVFDIHKAILRKSRTFYVCMKKYRRLLKEAPSKRHDDDTINKWIWLSHLLFIELNAQQDCYRKMLKFTLKCSYTFQFNKPSSVSLLLCFPKFIIIKLVSYKRRYESVRVASFLSSPFWCVYSAQCRVRLLLVCVQRTVQSETVIGVCTVHSAGWDRCWCVCTAQGRVRLLLVCAQCIVQSETVVGVCAAHSAVWDCYWCVHSA